MVRQLVDKSGQWMLLQLLLILFHMCLCAFVLFAFLISSSCEAVNNIAIIICTTLSSSIMSFMSSITSNLLSHQCSCVHIIIIIGHESDGDTSSNWCAQNNAQRLGKRMRRQRNQRTSGQHPDYSIIKIGQDTEKSPGDQRRLAAT